jgi:glucose uptake protein GlcU
MNIVQCSGTLAILGIREWEQTMELILGSSAILAILGCRACQRVHVVASLGQDSQCDCEKKSRFQRAHVFISSKILLTKFVAHEFGFVDRSYNEPHVSAILGHSLNM